VPPRLTTRALGRSILGVDVGENVDALSEPIRVALKFVADRAWRPVRAPSWLPTPARHRAYTALQVLRDYSADILRACRTDPNLDAPLVRSLIAATDPATGESLTDEEICNELVLFVVAGQDTTATALTYALWALGHHHEIQQRMAEEVRRLGDRRVAFEDVSNLPYTIQVLDEALRLCPPGPAIARLAMRDIEVDGCRVEAGTMIVVGIYAMHRDPRLWVDPLKFDPDRFSPENSRERDRWQYLPFAGGPRSCIGDHFAVLEAALALATIVRDVELHSLNEDFPLAVPFTMVAGGPIPSRITRRQ
jgi:cytochrome P450